VRIDSRQSAKRSNVVHSAAANKELTVAHEIIGLIQGAPLLFGATTRNLDLSALNTISNSEAFESQIASNWRIAV